MNFRCLLAILFTATCIFEAYGQWDPQISQYWMVRSFYNPAFSGGTDGIQAVALHRQQWMGFPGAPKTLIVAADMPLNFLGRTHGVGAVMMNESIGLFSNTIFGGQYVYKKKFKKNTLNVGVQLGMARIGFDAGDLVLPEDGQDDEAKPTMSEQSSAFDGNVGVTWIAPKYYIGISVTHVTEPTFEVNENSSSYITRTYYLTGGYNIQFKNPLYELQPSFLIKNDAVFTQYDVTARLVYNKMFNGGVSWRKDDGFVFLLGVRYKGFDAGYAYDLTTSEISNGSNGSHEFFLRYSMPLKSNKGEKNRHKSVRIL